MMNGQGESATGDPAAAAVSEPAPVVASTSSSTTTTASSAGSAPRRHPPVPPRTPVPPLPPPNWDRCHVYLPRKRRFCRQEPVDPPLSWSPAPLVGLDDDGDGDAVVAAMVVGNNKKEARTASDTSGCAPRYCGNHRHLYDSSFRCCLEAAPASANAAAPTTAGQVEDGSSTAGTGTAATAIDKAGGTTATLKRKRIACPHDPSHTIWEDQWERHKTKCPKVARQLRLQELDCYCHEKNRGGVGLLHFGNVKAGEVDGDGGEVDGDGAIALARRVLQVYSHVLDGGSIPLVDKSSPQRLEELREATDYYRIKTGGIKHLHQHASLIGHVRHILGEAEDNTLDGEVPTATSSNETGHVHREPITVLEMGAGRGVTGVLVAGVLNCAPLSTTSNPSVVSQLSALSSRRHVQLVMVDRGGSRGKADTVLRRAASMEPSKYLDLKLAKWRRITCDLNHLHVPILLDDESDSSNKREANVKVKEDHAVDKQVEASRDPLSNSSVSDPHTAFSVVVIAKHLCGSGTDVALKSLVDVRHRIRACAFTTCCHGLCTWDDYVGRNFLGNAMTSHDDKQSEEQRTEPVLPSFGKEEFDLMARWSAGTASCGHAAQRLPGSRQDPTEVGQHAHNNRSRSTCDNDSHNVVTIAAAIGVKPEDLGRACQRMIDFGRRDFLRSQIFAAEGPKRDSPPSTSSVQLVHYVPPEVTPQNALLLAWR